MIGWACRQLVIWGGLCLLLYAAVSHRELLLPQDDGKAAAATATAPTGQPQQPAFNALTYHADKHGQFWVDGAANGAAVHFLVDTGASSVALTLADAAAAGIGRGSLDLAARDELSEADRRFRDPRRGADPELAIAQPRQTLLPGLVSGIHVFGLLRTPVRKTWMAGTGPATGRWRFESPRPSLP